MYNEQDYKAYVETKMPAFLKWRNHQSMHPEEPPPTF